MYKFLCKHLFSIFLGISLGGELLGHMVNLCLNFFFFSNCQTIFWSGCTILHSLQQGGLLFLEPDYSQLKGRKPAADTILRKESIFTATFHPESARGSVRYTSAFSPAAWFSPQGEAWGPEKRSHALSPPLPYPFRVCVWDMEVYIYMFSLLCFILMGREQGEWVTFWKSQEPLPLGNSAFMERWHKTISNRGRSWGPSFCSLKFKPSIYLFHFS